MPESSPNLTSLRAARQALDDLIADARSIRRIDTVADCLAACFQGGSKVLICGNGGSACDAMHFAEEFTGRFRGDRPPLPAIALTDPAHLTCTANDYGFEFVFSRLVEAYARTGDLLFVLSTSGDSPSVINAVQTARAHGVVSIALLGKEGGRLAGLCDHEWVVPGETTDRIQELHMLILHVLIEATERRLYPALYEQETRA